MTKTITIIRPTLDTLTLVAVAGIPALFLYLAIDDMGGMNFPTGVTIVATMILTICTTGIIRSLKVYKVKAR